MVPLAVLLALAGGGVAAAGDKGTPKLPGAGPQNLGTYKIVSSYTYPVQPGQINYAYANCPPGTSVLGGGANNNAPGQVVLTDSYPGGSTYWIAYVRNNGTVAYNFTAWAVCGS
jgi:hypothetical protein